MPAESSCQCCGAPTLIFSCSGAADVGALADRAARELTRQGKGKMFCLAGIGGRVSGIMKSTEAAGKILALDGCPLDCARKSLEEAGFKGFLHARVTDMGFEKGRSELSEANVGQVAGQAGEML